MSSTAKSSIFLTLILTLTNLGSRIAGSKQIAGSFSPHNFTQNALDILRVMEVPRDEDEEEMIFCVDSQEEKGDMGASVSDESESDVSEDLDHEEAEEEEKIARKIGQRGRGRPVGMKTTMAKTRKHLSTYQQMRDIPTHKKVSISFSLHGWLSIFPLFTLINFFLVVILPTY